MLFINALTRRACAGFISLCTAANGTVALAADEEALAPATALSLPVALELALRRNPDLADASYLLRVADARVSQAGLRPATELSLQTEDFFGSGHARGFSGAQTTLALSQVMELGDRRDRRTSAATAARDLTVVDAQARQLDVLAEVTRRFIEVAAGQQRLTLATRSVDLAGRTIDEVGRRVEAAGASEVDLHRAHIAESKALLARENAEHELLSARYKLVAMWGETDVRRAEVAADLDTLPEPESFDTLVARLRGNPDFLRFVSERRLREAELRLAESRRRPDIQLAAGVRRFEQTDDAAFLASVSVPLFAGRRSSSGVAEAQGRRDLVDAQREAAFIRIRAQLFELYQELGHALNEASALRDEIIPALEAVQQQAEAAYRRGRYAYLEWTAAQAELLDARAALIEAAADAHRTLAEIERLTGEPVATSTN